jgi:hypothetical protein
MKVIERTKSTPNEINSCLNTDIDIVSTLDKQLAPGYRGQTRR